MRPGFYLVWKLRNSIYSDERQTQGLSMSATAWQSQLEALGASTPESIVVGDCEMAAFVTGESPVPSGCHCLKLIA